MPAALPVKTVPELVTWLKANPQKANFGSPAAGSLPHFFGVMIARDAGVDLVHVPYNGGGPLMNALMGNQVSSAIDTLVDQIELQRAGKAPMSGVPPAPIWCWSTTRSVRCRNAISKRRWVVVWSTAPG